MAPEIVRGEDYGCEVDIWSTGVITYILLTGDAPFNGKNLRQIQTKIKANQVTFKDQYGNSLMSPFAEDFIKKALNSDQ